MLKFVGFLLLMALPAQAQDSVLRFEARWGLFRVADITLTLRDDDSGYDARGIVTSSGLVALFRDVRLDMHAVGRRENGVLRPTRYRENNDTGRRQSRVDLRFRRGVPEVIEGGAEAPAQPWHLDPALQTGTVDSMTALFRLMAPTPDDAPCGWSLATFDGARRSSLTLGPPRAAGTGVACDGAHTRLAGYAPEELEDQTVFPFTVWFERDAQGHWQLIRAQSQTFYGRVRIERRS